MSHPDDGFYYKEEANKFNFYRVPKDLFQDRYKNLDPLAKILYGFLLDRNSLSMENDWFDSEGRVYIIFERQETAKLLNINKNLPSKLFKQLKEYNLIYDKRQGLNRSNLIYVKKIVVDIENTDVDRNPQKRDSSINRGIPKSRILESKKTGLNYINNNKTKKEEEEDSRVPQSTNPVQQETISIVEKLIAIYPLVNKSTQTILSNIWDKGIKDIPIGLVRALIATVTIEDIDLAMQKLATANNVDVPNEYFKTCLWNIVFAKSMAIPTVEQAIVESDATVSVVDESTVVEIVNYLNETTGSNYKPSTKETVRLIDERLKEGYTVQDFKTVIYKKTVEWKGKSFEKHLTPTTLFGKKFETYLNQRIKEDQGTVNPIPQTGNYEQREYDEEYLNSFYANVWNKPGFNKRE